MINTFDWFASPDQSRHAVLLDVSGDFLFLGFHVAHQRGRTWVPVPQHIIARPIIYIGIILYNIAMLVVLSKRARLSGCEWGIPLEHTCR